MFEVIAYRGSGQFLVKQNGKYYLVNLRTKEAWLADPPVKPDMFLKLGYWNDFTVNLSVPERDQIKEILSKV